MAIEDYLTSPCKIEILYRNKNKTKLKITLQEGRKRQIRKMFASAGHQVRELKRIQFGKLKLENLKVGQWQYIKKTEIV